MICCLNPRCRKPQNPDDAQVCQTCGSSLKPLRGRYRAVQPIGQGGFGRTYLALDEDRLGTRCVIKQFSPQIQGTKSLEKAVRLFNQEAVRLHELGEHPQIPTLLAYFEQDQYLYLVQQFIEGQNLLQIMRQHGPFNERQIREVLSDLLPVLRFVHSKQVIHRDITPTNILRRQPDDRLMLIDFGVAKQLDASTSGEPGTRIGTEGYAPMEQFRGGRAYPASDIYSLGATCLHLLTETKPDNLYDPLNGCWFWREHLLEKGITVSDQMAEILDRMLKDLLSERYQSADEVMRDLNADSFNPVRTMKPPSTPPISAPPTPASKIAKSTAAPSVSRPPTSGSQPVDSLRPAARASTPPLPLTPSGPNLSTSRAFSSSRELVSASGWRCIHHLTGHSSWITSVAVNPTTQVLASGSLDDTVKVWNLQTGDLVFTLTGHTRDVNTIAISPNGKTLTSGSDDYTLKTWSLQTGTLMRTLTGHSRDVNAIAISADGHLLVTGSEDRTIRLWQMGAGAPLRTMMGVGSIVKALAISADGRTLASGGLDNKVKLWNLQTGEQLWTLAGHFSAINTVAFSPNGQILASGSKDKTIKLWNLQTGELLRSLSAHGRDVNAIAFTPDGSRLISGSSDATIKLWNAQTGEVIDTLTGHLDSVNAIALLPDGKTLVSGASDNVVRVWKMD